METRKETKKEDICKTICKRTSDKMESGQKEEKIWKKMKYY